jgi:hypothetical protein
MALLPLRGRDAEVAALERMVRGLGDGAGGALVVTGTPGIGKSRLIADAVQHARTAGVLVADGRAQEFLAVSPMAPLLAALQHGDPPVLDRHVLRALERPGDQRYWLVEELAERLEARSLECPLIIVLDDLQWSDDATLAAAWMLRQWLASAPVAWVLAARAPGARPAVTRLLDDFVTSGATRDSTNAQSAISRAICWVRCRVRDFSGSSTAPTATRSTRWSSCGPCSPKTASRSMTVLPALSTRACPSSSACASGIECKGSNRRRSAWCMPARS